MAYKTFNRFLKSLSIKKKLTYTLIPAILVTYLLSVGSVYKVSFHETKSIVNQQAQTLANQRTQLVDSYLDQLRTETEIFMFDTAKTVSHKPQHALFKSAGGTEQGDHPVYVQHDHQL